jgi:hypothetical protein
MVYYDGLPPKIKLANHWRVTPIGTQLQLPEQLATIFLLTTGVVFLPFLEVAVAKVQVYLSMLVSMVDGGVALNNPVPMRGTGHLYTPTPASIAITLLKAVGL